MIEEKMMIQYLVLMEVMIDAAGHLLPELLVLLKS